MRYAYAPGYVVPLPEGHPFPMGKFAILHELLLAEDVLRESDRMEPALAPWDDLRLVHTEAYVRKVATGTFTREEERRLGLPWSPNLALRSRIAVSGTLLTARAALDDGLAANLAGGTHHACPDHGEGFCVLNDVAIAIRVLQREGWDGRVLILDLDVHQGNGNALVFGPEGPERDRVWTFSMHGERNFPMRKPPSWRDVGLDDGCDDTTYLATLDQHLDAVMDAARPDLVFYLAGVDPVAGDRYGRLALTRHGLDRRDRRVLDAVRERGAAVALLLSGGYAPTPAETAALHAITHRVAREVFGRSPRPRV